MRWSVLLPVLFAASLALAQPKSEPVLIAKPDSIPTLVNPNCSHCVDEAKRRADELRDGDRVLAWTRGKYDGGAIPFRFFLNHYRVISDTYGVFVHDPDAGFARAFEPSLDFRFHGWRNGVMVMKHQDGTLFSTLSGAAFDGPRKGERLKPFPTIVTDWGWWLKQYPGTVAYHMYPKYKPVDLPAKPNPDARASRGPADRRLPDEERVLGVWDGKLAWAWPLRQSGEEIQVKEFGAAERPGVLLWYGPTKTATAYAAVAEKLKPTARLGYKGDRLEARKVKLAVGRADSPAPFVDQETESTFDIAGRCVEGPLKGWTLEPLDAVQVKWFAWAAEYPKTAIVP
jgi:hypothetical protein